MVQLSLGRATGAFLVLAGLSPFAVLAQSPPPGRAHLFVLDLSGTPVGEFPTTIKQLKGSLEVAMKDGVPMLKASVSSEFLITLPQTLPTDFTLEFDLVPKACCAPQDLSFEGTPLINQGAGSAHVLWDSDGYLAIIGGGGTNHYEAPMPEDLRATLPGVLTNVVAVVQGPTIRLYTNGRRHYTLDRNFARGRVLRVFLGVDAGRQDPVHLAGLRILAGAHPPTAGTPIAPGLVTPPGGSITPMPAPPPPPVTVLPAVPPPASITPMAPPQPPTVPAPTGRVPSAGGASTIVPAGPATLTTSNRPGWGATLQWTEVVNATGYQVDRSVAGGGFVLFAGVDAKAHPAVGGLHSSEDVTVQPGTQYQYRVMAQLATGPASSYSPTATFDASNMIAQVSNLSATLGPSFRVTPTSTAPPQRTVTWAWQGVPGALSYEAEIETFSAVSGAGASLGKTRLTLPATTYSASVETGRSVSICISLIRPATASDPLRYGVCRMTDVTLPLAAPAPTPWFRVVALGFWVSGHTWDNVLNFDGVEDEVYLATVVNATDLSLSSSTVTASKSATFGDVGGFPNRLLAGSASPNGGLVRGDAHPRLLDLNAATRTPSRDFPLLLWEGPVDDQTMIVLHPTLWEEDKGINPYLAWVRTQTNRAKSGYIGITRSAIQSLRDAQAFGPGVGEKIVSCVNPPPPRRIYIDVCIEGEDRPIGLVVFNLVDYWIDDRFIVLTRASIEKSLSLPPSPQGKVGQAGFNAAGPGIITVGFRDAAQQSPFGQGNYLLYLRVERLP